MTSRNEPIAVFAYAFPHRKTQDFLVELAAAGFRKVCVIAAPWRKLAHHDPNTYFSTNLRNSTPLHTSEICEALGFEFREVEHSDAKTISKFREQHGFELGIIAGARILTREVIEIFKDGVLNLHPGKMPETSGLDLFYYTIANNVSLGVTAHFIDARVDAGMQMFFEETPLGPEDTPEVVQHNNYHSQIRALRRFILLRDRGALELRPVIRPCKNDPMSPDQKRRVISAFPDWRVAQYRAQRGRALITACENGSAEDVSRILTATPDLLEFRSVEGWNPLIVASFNQRADVVALLLERGADPNACGKKGTTVLMYAKTAIMKMSEPDYTIMERLLDVGADPHRCDSMGRDIFHYLRLEGDSKVSAWLKTRRGEA